MTTNFAVLQVLGVSLRFNSTVDIISECVDKPTTFLNADVISLYLRSVTYCLLHHDHLLS